MLNLDTHMLYFAVREELTRKERELLNGDRWGISAIVLWEMVKLHHLGRVTIAPADPSMAAVLQRVHVWPITLEVCEQLRRLDFRSDPADEIIAATSLAYNVPLLTRDTRILASKIVPFALPA